MNKEEDKLKEADAFDEDAAFNGLMQSFGELKGIANEAEEVLKRSMAKLEERRRKVKDGRRRE